MYISCAMLLPEVDTFFNPIGEANMELKLERDGLMHSSLIKDLAHVAHVAGSIDEAYSMMQQWDLSDEWWQIYRGGHHVALLYVVNKGRPEMVRVAMIREA